MNETAEIVSRQIYLKINEKYPMPEEGEVRFEKELFGTMKDLLNK